LSEAGTSGGRDGTGGIAPGLLRVLLLAVFLAYGVIQMIANVTSQIADRAKLGVDVPEAAIWWLEASSLTGWTVMLLPIWWAVTRFRPPLLAWPLVPLAHAAMTVAVSLGHVAVMVALRKLGWWAAGDAYVFGVDVPSELLYEYRKDVATYVQLALVIGLIEFLIARYAAPAPAPAPAMPEASPVLEVADGAVTHRVPVAEIDHVSAAGNYVELAWGGRTLLHRATLAAVEGKLAGHGFARIHRSRLVRLAAVRAVHGMQSGDFEVELASGERLRGSRRYRDGLGES